MGDSAGVEYLSGSYQTVGQDGQHYNGSLLDAPGNMAAPAQVVQALYEMSDHLPVRADFVLHTATETTHISPAAASPAVPDVRMVNPVGDWLEVALGADFARGPVTITMHSMQGVQVFRLATQAVNGVLHQYIGSEVLPGLYTLVLEGADGTRIVRKVLKR